MWRADDATPLARGADVVRPPMHPADGAGRHCGSATHWCVDWTTDDAAGTSGCSPGRVHRNVRGAVDVRRVPSRRCGRVRRDDPSGDLHQRPFDLSNVARNGDDVSIRVGCGSATRAAARYDAWRCVPPRAPRSPHSRTRPLPTSCRPPLNRVPRHPPREQTRLIRSRSPRRSPPRRQPCCWPRRRRPPPHPLRSGLRPRSPT
jgi:hypothetical protein